MFGDNKLEKMYRSSIPSVPLWTSKPVQPKLEMIKQILDSSSDVPDRDNKSPEAVLLRSIRSIIEAED